MTQRFMMRQLFLWLAGFVLAMCWDRAAYLYLSFPADRDSVAHSPAYIIFYTLGTLWPWCAVAAAIILIEFFRAPPPRRENAGRIARSIRRGLFVLASAAIAGGLAEIGKILFRRIRPIKTDGWYHFRSFLEHPFQAGDDVTPLSLPSSHVAVAFGGAFALGLLFPRYRLIFLLAAAGTVFARILPGAHFLSDCYLAVFLAFLSARVVYPLFLPPR